MQHKILALLVCIIISVTAVTAQQPDAAPYVTAQPDAAPYVSDPIVIPEAYPTPTSDVPACVNGYIESNGMCNCYSGYYNANDNSSQFCTDRAPYYCGFFNQTDSVSNDWVPWWGYADLYGDQLSWTFYSNLVVHRRTLIELPNSQCNSLSRPEYFKTVNDGCVDRFEMTFPYLECGFTKTSSSPYEDIYTGTVNVKQIDLITVGGITTERVINTPFPMWIRMSKQLWVQTSIQLSGPPSFAIDAAFVGQEVSAETRSGNLQYMSVVQYPLQIEAVELVGLPYGVNAWVELLNVNCTEGGPCIQRVEVHFNTTNCYFSGTYRMLLSVGCRSDLGCPAEAKNHTQAYIESRIVAQRVCPEVAVNIDLNGYIQMYSDAEFTQPALAFYPGQTAYFLINAYSSRVNLSKVTFDYVTYDGPNVGWNYLYYYQQPTGIALANNFTLGSRGNSQAWFSVDVAVSTTYENQNTLFKLNPGQNGVYNFVAVVYVEYSVANNGSNLIGPPTDPSIPTEPPVEQYNVPTPFKKRMVLQGSTANQGSQFAAQVQIAGPTPSVQQQTPPVSDPVSSSVSVIVSWMVVMALASALLF